MAKKAYVGVNNVARNISKVYVGMLNTYTPVEYIQNTGTQYIDTGYKPNNNTKIEFSCSLDYGAVGNYTLFGARDYSGTTLQGGYCMFKFNGNTWRSDYYASGSNFTYTTAANTTYTVVKDKNITYINGTQVYSNTATTFTIDTTLKLFRVENEVEFNPISRHIKIVLLQDMGQ